MKSWKKPTISLLRALELTAYIKVAARSDICWAGHFR